MTFTYDGADLSTTIKTFYQQGTYYHIVYLDECEYRYHCTDSREYSRLNNLMLLQAKERKDKMSTKELQLRRFLLELLQYLSMYMLLLSAAKKEILNGLISIIITALNTTNLEEVVQRIEELKKYELFIEIMSDIKKVNESELLSCLEFEKMYQMPLDFAHLDEYSYGDIKRVRKKLNKLRQKNSGE